MGDYTLQRMRSGGTAVFFRSVLCGIALRSCDGLSDSRCGVGSEGRERGKQ